MNLGQLRSLVKQIIADEAELKVQKVLTQFRDALNNAVQSPSAPTQLEVASKFGTLQQVMRVFAGRYQPAQQHRLEEMHALGFFNEDFPVEIEQMMASNQMTLAIVQQAVDKFLKQRQGFLDHMNSVSNSFNFLQLGDEEIDSGRPEVGFQIPRHIFKSELDGLLRELRVIRSVIRTVSQLELGSVPEIEVTTISTSDPMFFFGLDPIVAAQIGVLVTWALNTWKQVEDIRKIRAETSKISAFSAEEIEKIFGDKIKKQVDISIAEKAQELLASSKAKHKPPEKEVEWVLESILTRIERGMTVEIKFIPPPVAQPESDAEGKQLQAFNTLQSVVPQLVFSKPEPDPVLKLPPPEPPKTPTK